MDINDVIAYATEGLTEEQAKPIREALLRDNVKAKFGTVKAQKEYEAIALRAAEADRALQELDGVDEKNEPKGYRAWYKKYGPLVLENSKKIAAFDQKYGEGSFAKVSSGEVLLPNGAPPNTPPSPNAKTYSEEDIQRIVDSRIGAGYAPKWSNLITQSGTVLQKHLFAGRKTPIDFAKLAEIAAKKNGDLEAAYDEYDLPEREKANEASIQSRIDQGVKEALQRRGADQNFPIGEPQSPSPLSSSSERSKGFDREKFRESLMQTAATGEMPKVN